MIIYLGAPNYIRGTISVSWIRVYSAAAATAGRISRCERFRAPRDESESVARFLDKSPRREKYKGTQPATVFACPRKKRKRAVSPIETAAREHAREIDEESTGVTYRLSP